MVGTRRRASAASAAGSVPTTATRAPSRSASFSCITPASEPNPSTCAYPTFVITAIVGSITSRRRGISPGTLAPASTTRASASSGAPRIVSGTPTRLFRLPAVACTRYVVPSTARIISFVLVLPLEPVTATTGLPGASRRRRARASSPSAASGSRTSKNGSPSTDGVPLRTTAAAAPLPFASARKSWASKRSPLSATNKVPGGRCRVSVETPLNVRFAGARMPSASATRALVQTVTTPRAPSLPSARRTAAFPFPPPGTFRGPSPRAGSRRAASPARARARSPCGGPLRGDGACPASRLRHRRGSSRGPRCGDCRTWRSRCRRGARTPPPWARVCRGRGRRHELKAGAGGVERYAACRRLAAALAERDAAVRAAQSLPRGIVGVHDLEAVRGEVPDELRLGVEIVVDRLVVVEVIARQVREDRGAEHEAVHPPLVEAVRGHLHRGAARAPLDQRRERRLQGDRARRREIPGFARHGQAGRVERPAAADRTGRLEGRQHVARQRH